MKEKQTLGRKVGRVMWIAVAVAAACIGVLVGYLLIISPGKTTPFVDENGKIIAGSISDKTFVEINGVRQGMFIKSKNEKNPVLLYLHGGMPDYFLSEKYPTGLENYFTVVWWEQRGSGISYGANIPRETMTMEQMIADTIAMTNYLRERFGQEKIYLMGHSGGTFIGIQAAAQHPELYHAYLGEAQMSYQLRSEVLAYEYMLGQYKAQGDTRMVRKLEAYPVSMETGTPAGYDLVRDMAMHSLGIGTMHEMKSIVTGIIVPSFASRDYTLAEKINMWRSKAQAGISILWPSMTSVDLSQKVTELAIPVYFIEGRYDYTCAYSLAKEYFEKIQAPVKGFYTFEQSAHSPMFEEPEKLQKIVRDDVLKAGNSLADLK